MRAATAEAGLLVHRKTFTVKSETRRHAVDVKPEVESAIRDAGVQQGMVLVNCLHTTCSVVITDADIEDFVGLMARLIEDEGAYGTAHVAVGNNLNFTGGRNWAPIHFDHVFRRPTIRLDGVEIMVDGRLTDAASRSDG